MCWVSTTARLDVCSGSLTDYARQERKGEEGSTMMRGLPTVLGQGIRILDVIDRTEQSITRRKPFRTR